MVELELTKRKTRRAEDNHMVSPFKLVRTHIVRARVDVVATKLGIILSSSFFLSSFVQRKGSSEMQLIMDVLYPLQKNQRYFCIFPCRS